MMKKYTIFIHILLAAINCFGQGLRFEASFDKALVKAAAESKPLFIYLTPPGNLPQTSQLYTTIPDRGEVPKLYNNSFINFTASVTDPEAEKIRSLYKIQIFPAYVFLDSKGLLVYKTGGNVFAPERFTELANTALTRISTGKTIGHYEDLLRQDKLTRTQLEDYITLRQELDLHDNADLADKYVGMLTVNELDDYNKVLFILKMGPYAYGKAFSLAYTNKKIPDSIYKHEPLPLRKTINNRIITNSRTKAIKEKDIRAAQNLANFVRTTWGTDFKEAQKNYTEELLNYYKAVKDTTNYYSQASFYYDQYLNITADSAKRLQSKTLEALRTPDAIKPQINVVASGDNVASFGRVVAIPTGDQISSALNNGAYSFYILGTNNINLLVKALIWSKRSIEMHPLPEYYDTMAHIMYKMKLYDEAILNQTKAIDLAKTSPVRARMVTTLQTELDKMKARQL